MLARTSGETLHIHIDPPPPATEFRDVECPRCGRMIGRILRGAGEWPCRKCKVRIQAASDGRRVQITQVTKLPARRRMAPANPA